MDSDPVKRPTTQDIIERFGELEHTYGSIEDDLSATPIQSMASPDFGKLLDVYPLEFRLFPMEPDNRIQSPLTLTNRTDHHIGVWITPSFPDSCPGLGFLYARDQDEEADDHPGSLFCQLGPRCTKVVYMTMMEQQQQPLVEENMAIFKVMMMATESEEAVRDLESLFYSMNDNTKMNTIEDLLRSAKELGTEVVHKATLRALVTCEPAITRDQEVVSHQFITASDEFGSFCSMDVHPTETWVLVGHYEGYVSIWNYETQERVMLCNITYSDNNRQCHQINAAKFIAREQWFTVGDQQGFVHVYSYTTKNKVKEFKADDGCRALNLLAIHPTNPLLLTASTYDKLIKLWDWGQDWTCTRVFDNMDDTVWRLTFGPRGTNSFASASFLCDVKVWDIHCPYPIATFKGNENITFYSESRRHFLVTTGATDIPYNSINIWNLQTKKSVHTLGVTRTSTHRVACHHRLPILATITKDYTGHRHIFLWDTRTYRLMKTFYTPLDSFIICMVFDNNEDLTRLVVSCSDGISIIKINVPMLLTGGPN
ncbi:unnamed protein product [Urochloa humidicola]